MASYSKEVAVVAGSIHCLRQETEQYEVCSPEFNFICICAKTTPETYFYEKEE